MPNNWKTYKLGDIAKLRKEGIKPSEFNGEKYIGLEHIGQGNFLLDSIGDASDVTSNKSKFWEGDILYGKIRPYFKKVYRPKFSGICSTDMLIFNTQDESLVTQSYLHQFIKTQEFTDKATETSTGTKMPRADWNSLKLWEIQLPPLPEQKAIANILSAIDNKIENNLAINKTLEDMAMALYKHWFVDFGLFQGGEFVDSELGRIPKGWEVKRLDEVCKFSNGYAFKSKELLKTEEPDCYHVFKMGNIERGGGLKANGSKSFIKKSESSSIKKYILKKGDLLMAMTDMKDKVAILGNTALIDIDDKYIVNQRVGLIRINNDIGIDFPFMFLATNEYNFLKNLRNQANSGVQVNLSTNAIKSAKLIIGDVQTNIKFNKLVKENYETIFKNSQENQTLTTLRDTLLPRLISGEVRLKEFREEIEQVM